MEPNNIDNQIYEKLSKREIKPSQQSWDRLDAMLTLKEEQKSIVKRSFKWWYVAASIVFFSGIVIFNYQPASVNDMAPQKTVVSTSNFQKKVTEETLTASEEKDLKTSSNSSIQLNSIATSSNQTIAKTLKNDVKNTTPSTVATNTNQTFALHESKNAHTLSIDELLNSIDNAKIAEAAHPNIKVNANSLLNSIEKELNEDYKETKMEKVSRNFYQIKTALANRNYEEN